MIRKFIVLLTLGMATSMITAPPVQAVPQAQLQIRDPLGDMNKFAWNGAGRYFKRGSDIRQILFAPRGDRTVIRVSVSTLHNSQSGSTSYPSQKFVIFGTQGSYRFTITAANNQGGRIVQQRVVNGNILTAPRNYCDNVQGQSRVKIGRDFRANSILFSVPNNCLPKGNTMQGVSALVTVYKRGNAGQKVVAQDRTREVNYRFR